MSESSYDSLIIAAARRHGVPPALVKGTIKAESNFSPNAVREEPQINDASIGLMQLLTQTAGLSRSELFDPATNIEAGASLLGRLLQARGGDLAKAVSSYNGGYRPTKGLGAPLTGSDSVTIVLARDSAGKPIRTQVTKPGEYANADYVRMVLTYAAQYEPALSQMQGIQPPASIADSVFSIAKAQVKGGSAFTTAAIVAGGAGSAVLLIGALGLLALRKAGA